MDSQACLRRIINTAEALQRDTKHFCMPHAGPSTEVFDVSDIKPLALSIPSSTHLVPELLELGAPQKVAEIISQKYHASAMQLAEYQISSVYMDALRKLRGCFSLGDADFIAAFQEAHRQTYCRNLSQWKTSILGSVKGKFVQSAETVRKRENKSKLFDQKFVPLLEKCFEKNQRPNRGDKELLSRKTDMSYRQIHVWFQNRRSRAKKPSEEADAQYEEPTCSSRASSATLVEDDPLPNSVAPSYAFPAQYPPEVLEDPFPCRCGDLSSFVKPHWPRTPSTTCRPPSDLDISKLVTEFEKLRLSDAVKKGRTKKKASSVSEQESASKLCGEVTWPFIIRPLRAPLAALIRSGTSCLLRLSCTASSESESNKQGESSSRSKETPASKPRKTRQRSAGKQGRSATSKVQEQQPQIVAEPTLSSTPSDASPPSKVKKSGKRVPRAKPYSRKSRKANSAPDAGAVETEAAKQPPEPPLPHPSPTLSIDSLPSLSYSSGSASSSTYSQSPTSSFSALSDDGRSPPHDPYQSSDLSLTLPTSQTTYDEHPSSTSAFDGFSFDLAKGPLDYSFNFGLPEYPSYSDTFDSLSQELQTSSDFEPLLSFELPPLAS